MKRFNLIPRLACLILLFSSSFLMAQSQLDTDPIIDWPMRTDPNLTPDAAPNMLPDTLHKVWLAALDQPELEVRMQTMQAISQANEMGVKGLNAVYGLKLKALASDTKSSPALAMSAVSTLIALNETSAADILLAHNQAGKTDWILLTDSTLARWQTPQIIDTWIKRATDPTLGWTVRHSALEQLALTHPEKAQGPLRQLLGESSLDPLLKLQTGKALGQIATRGLLADAQRLAKGDLVNKLAAIACLASHDTPEAKTFLVSMLSDKENSACILAAGQILLKNAPDQLVTHVKPLLHHADAPLRELSARCLVSQITPARVPDLASLLNDANPDIRKMVRDELIGLAKQSELAQPIKDAALNVLKQNSWQGQEQAAIVLGKLDVKSSVDALFEVLTNSPRMEARLAAATAIRWLNIADKQQQALDLAGQLFKDMQKNLASTHAMELAQLLQWFGQSQYANATTMLIDFIPKNIAPSVAREAAVWSIGKIGKTPQTQNLGNKLMARIKDANEMNPESPDVQIAAMATLARIGQETQLIRFLESTSNSNAMVMMDMQVIELCKAWATAMSQGKPYVAPAMKPSVPSGWFLQPQKMELPEN